MALPGAAMAEAEPGWGFMESNAEYAAYGSSLLVEPSLTVRGNVLHIQNAQGSALEVYDVTGKRVILQSIESNDKTVTLNLNKGCYIVRIGKLTRKISLS